MSNEEMNKKMEFIVEHQAKFAAEIEIMREAQAQQDRRLSSAMVGLVEIVGGLTRAQIETDEVMKRLAEAQQRTEGRLNIFINVVERYISGNGGGKTNPA